MSISLRLVVGGDALSELADDVEQPVPLAAALAAQDQVGTGRVVDRDAEVAAVGLVGVGVPGRVSTRMFLA
jgi:hypothetical protein